MTYTPTTPNSDGYADTKGESWAATGAKPMGKPGSFWREQVDRALQRRRDLEPWWDANDKAYAPGEGTSPEQYAGDINTNRDFTLVERKKADLFCRRPELTAEPAPWMDGPIMTGQTDPMTGQPQPMMGPPNAQGQAQPITMQTGLQAHLEILNKQLDVTVNAVRMAQQAIFDVLDLSGVGFTCMGYESVTVDVPQTPAPNPLAPMTDTATTPIAQPQMVPVPIYENCFWHHVSPKQAIVPANFRSTEWDTAPFLGYQFELPLTPGNRAKFKLPPDFEGKRTDDKQYFGRGGSNNESGQDVFTGVILWYRSCLFRDDRPHPFHLTKLVLVDGVDEPTIEEDCPDQTISPTGDLSPDSLVGFPVHPLNLRTRTDSAWPPADMTLTRPLVNELNRSREQNLEYRDAMTMKWMANADVLPAEVLNKMVRGPIGGIIMVPGEAYVGEGAIKELPQGSMPRENFAIANQIDNDISRTLALDASQQGVQPSDAQTATATQVQQANANARLDTERSEALTWYCKGAMKYSTLIQRWFPVEKAAQIVGPERAQIWNVWRKQVPAAIAFTAMPDSALRVDEAVDRKQMQDFYSFVANDPYVQKGRPKLLEKLFRKHHLDPAGIVMPPDPPKPEPPKVNFSFKGEDLVAPQAPIVLEICQQLGIVISPDAVSQSQAFQQQALQLAAMVDATKAGPGAKASTEHPGKQAPAENLSKHHSDETGAMQGLGGHPAALGAPGGMVQ